MSTSTLQQEPRFPSFNSNLKWSIIGHFTLILFVLIRYLIFPGKPASYVPTLKVDLVGLPDLLKKDLNSAHHSTQLNHEISQVLKSAEQKANQIQSQAKSHKEVEVAKSDEMVIKPKSMGEKSRASDKQIEKRNKRALDRLKSLSKLEDVSLDQPIRGNKLSAGLSTSLDARESAEANYYDNIRDRLQNNFTLPAWISRQSLTAQLQIFIDTHGNLREMKFLKSSGNSQFDEAVKRAVQDSLPFPPPPKDLQSTLINDGISLGFPL